MLSKSFLIKPLAAAALLAVAGASQATVTVYTSQAAFLAAISNVGVDTFDNMALSSVPSPIFRNAGPYSYTGAVSTTSFFQAGTTADVWLSTNTATDTITFNAFSGGVQGVGGNFFGSDINGAFLAGSLTITATDASGTVTQTLDATSSSSFLGFVSNGAMTSLTVTSVQPVSGFLWPTVNNLTMGVAAAVPEPQTFAMLLAGLGFVGFMARRRRG